MHSNPWTTVTLSTKAGFMLCQGSHSYCIDKEVIIQWEKAQSCEIELFTLKGGDHCNPQGVINKTNTTVESQMQETYVKNEVNIWKEVFFFHSCWHPHTQNSNFSRDTDNHFHGGGDARNTGETTLWTVKTTYQDW